MIQQLIDLGGRGTRTAGDALLARAANDVWPPALVRRHRLDDRLDTLELLFVEVLARLAGLLHRPPDPRQHLDQPEQAATASHLLELDHLVQEVLQVEVAFDDFGLHASSLLLVAVLLSTFDQAHHVTHAQDALGQPIGMEGLEGIDLLADADVLDGHAGHFTQRQSGATARIAVELGQDHARQRHVCLKAFGNPDCLLAGHSIGDQQGLVGLDAGLDRLELAHQLFVDLEAASRVDNDK